MSFKMVLLDINEFSDIESFWNCVTKDPKWYNCYQPKHIKKLDLYLDELTPLIIETTNKIRKQHSFTYSEYFHILTWDNIAIPNYLKAPLPLQQFCFNCKQKVDYFPRYPKHLCANCIPKLTDIKGRKIEFFNTHLAGYGCQGFYSDTEQEEKYFSNRCFIENVEYYANEAKFGGIIVQHKEQIDSI